MVARYEANTESGTKAQIKLMVFNDPDITSGEIMDKLAKKSTNVSRFTVDGIRSDTRQTLRLLRGRGLLSEKVNI